MSEKRIRLKSVYKRDMQDQNTIWLRLYCLNPNLLALSWQGEHTLVYVFANEIYESKRFGLSYSLILFQRVINTLKR